MDGMRRGFFGVLRNARDWFYAQKYRFDQGIQFLVFLNFALLVVTASDKLKAFTGIENTPMLVIGMIALAFVGVFVFGYILDRFVRQQQRQEIEMGRRSYLWQKTFANEEEILKEIAELKKLLKKR